MNEFSQELEYLRKAVRSKFGGPVETSNDFEALSFRIGEKTGQPLSASTLKRFYGYMSLHPKPRIATLDVLARFIGREDFRDLCRALQEGSAFLAGETLDCSALAPGREVVLRWLPDRQVRLRHGDGTFFEVVAPGTSKLRKGDVFSVSRILKGHPLYLTDIRRGGEPLPAYVAGRTAGIQEIEVY